MDYQIAFAPDLHIPPDTFISAWNDDPECRDKALAEHAHEPPAGFPIDPGTALIFLGGVATTIATGVITDLISKLLERKLFKDKEQPPVVLHAAMVRRNPANLQAKIEVQTSPTINVLIVTARPHGRRDVGYRTISRPLIEGLRKVEAYVQVDIVRPGTYRALVEHLRHTQRTHGVGHYHIIHFDLHGAVLTYNQLSQIGGMSPHTYKAVLSERYGRADLTPPPAEESDIPKAYLFFEAETQDDLDPAEASELARLLREYHIPIAILNACQSGQQIGDTETSLGSRLLQAGIQTVLAMGYSVTVSAAALMMQTLYQSLLRQHSLLVAFREARVALHNEKKRRAYFNQHINLEDWLLPTGAFLSERHTVN